MPLSPSQLRQLLKEKRDAFADFDQVSLELIRAYRTAWRQFQQQSHTDQLAVLGDEGNRGALPLETVPVNEHGLVPFSEGPWGNREESLVWAKDVLSGITTFAVDGSQIFPSKDLSIPIALVQVGWFENAHLPGGAYEKDIRLELMTPADLKSSDRALAEERRVNIRRFELEIERLVEYIQ
ncbi:NurA domain-containing protein, partial [filamentous cyanobacterium CCP5]